MKKHARIVGTVIAVAVVLALAGAWTVFAQSPTATPAAQQPRGMMGGGMGGMRGGGGRMDQDSLEAAAQALGMSADELSNQLWGGKTLSDLAEKAGVDLQKVRDAVNAAQKTATRAGIEQAVKDGRLTRDNADWLLTGLDKGYWGGQGGPELGGPGGRGAGFGPAGGRLGASSAQTTTK